MNKEQLAKQMFGKSYADLTIAQQIKVDDAAEAQKPIAGINTAAPSKTFTGPQGYGIYEADEQGNYTIFIGNPQAPPQININPTQPSQDAQRFTIDGVSYLQLETRVPGGEAKVVFKNLSTGEIVDKLPVAKGTSTSQARPIGSATTTGLGGKSTYERSGSEATVPKESQPVAPAGYLEGYQEPRYTGSRYSEGYTGSPLGAKYVPRYAGDTTGQFLGLNYETGPNSSAFITGEQARSNIGDYRQRATRIRPRGFTPIPPNDPERATLAAIRLYEDR